MGELDPQSAADGRVQRLRAVRWLLAGVAALLLALVIDGQRPPSQQVGVRLALGAIRVYQATASRAFGRMGLSCRFEPTCSHYGYAAIEHRGLGPGVWLAAKRVARCGPWTPAGTFDPPPGPADQPSAVATSR